jgi:hypothetical protein
MSTGRSVSDECQERAAASPAQRVVDSVAECLLAEARSRLIRLARCYLPRYQVAGPAAWDEPRGEAWALREIAEHVSGVTYYAEQIGRLS